MREERKRQRKKKTKLRAATTDFGRYTIEDDEEDHENAKLLLLVSSPLCRMKSPMTALRRAAQMAAK